MFIVPLEAGGVMGPNCSIEEVGKWELFGKIGPDDVGEPKYLCSDADVEGDN